MNIKEHIILGCITSHNCKEDIYKSHHKSELGKLFIESFPRLWPDQYLFFLDIVKTRQLFRTIKKTGQFCQHVLHNGIIFSMPAYLFLRQVATLTQSYSLSTIFSYEHFCFTTALGNRHSSICWHSNICWHSIILWHSSLLALQYCRHSSIC